MNIFREGRLRNSDPFTGDVLCLDLDRSDVARLRDQRYTMNRFAGMRSSRQNLGWDSMDKAHVNLEVPRIHPEDDEKLVTLSLDPGGDLYFVIWESDRLRTARSSEQFTVNDILSHDPSSKLERLGILQVRFFGMSALAHELYTPKWFVADS